MSYKRIFLGVLQAEALGKLFRTLYPGIRRTDGRDCPEDTQGLGFLRLHSTYRHDLKIYSSDEGRVQMTAAAFAKVYLFILCLMNLGPTSIGRRITAYFNANG